MIPCTAWTYMASASTGKFFKYLSTNACSLLARVQVLQARRWRAAGGSWAAGSSRKKRIESTAPKLNQFETI